MDYSDNYIALAKEHVTYIRMRKIHYAQPKQERMEHFVTTYTKLQLCISTTREAR